MKKNSFQIARIKSNCLKLRGNHQLPSYLVYLILQIDKNTSESVIRALLDLSYHYLRVSGYYKKFPFIEKQYNDEIKKQLLKKTD